MKEYKGNLELREYLENNISKMKVDKEYKPIIVDILMRRAFQYNLSMEDVEKDVSTLMSSLRKIVIAPEEKDIDGLYFPDKKRILINQNVVFRKDEEDLYEVMTHELYHALTTDEKGNDRLGGINTITNQPNYSLLEAIVEKASLKTVYDTHSLEGSRQGYKELLFITDCLEACYGVTEQEFLSHAIRDREELIDFLHTRGNEPREHTVEFLDSIEANLAMLHNVMYPNLADKKIPKKQHIDTIKNSMTGIYGLCIDQLQYRMQQAPITTMQEAEEFQGEIEFNYNKLRMTLMRQLDTLSEKYDYEVDFEREVTNRTYSQKCEVMRRINNHRELIRNADKIPTEDEKVVLSNWARFGNLAMYEEAKLKEYGIDPEYIIEIYPDDDFEERYTDPYETSDGWDNSEQPKYLKEFAYSKIKMRYRALESVKQFGNKVKSRIGKIFTGRSEKQELLEEGELDEEEIADSIFDANSTEEQEIYNRGVQEAVENMKNSESKASSETEKIDEIEY